MELLIAQALPPPPVAKALIKELPKLAPHLTSWLQASTVQRRDADPAQLFCTPEQAWLLERAGFQPQGNQPLGAAWPAFTVSADFHISQQDPTWLAMPCHLAVSTTGVTLRDLTDLDLQTREAAELYAAIRADLGEVEVALQCAPEATPWRWRLPPEWTPWNPTPECAEGEEIQHLWSQQSGERPWRRLLNLIQMVWHDHPVNQARQAAGQLPINSIWLWGGASPNELPKAAEARATQRIHDLVAPANTGDWQEWRNALQKLDRDRLASLPQRPTRVVLTGATSHSTFEVGGRSMLQRLLPGRRSDWQAGFLES